MNVVEEKDPYETINIDSNKCQIINILTTCCRKKTQWKYWSVQDIIIILQNEMVTSGVGNLIHVKDTDWKFVYVIVVCGTVITIACPNQDTQRRMSPWIARFSFTLQTSYDHHWNSDKIWIIVPANMVLGKLEATVARFQGQRWEVLLVYWLVFPHCKKVVKT